MIENKEEPAKEETSRNGNGEMIENENNQSKKQTPKEHKQTDKFSDLLIVDDFFPLQAQSSKQKMN